MASMPHESLVVEGAETGADSDDVEYIEIDKNPIATDLMLPYEASIFTELHESDSSGGALLISSNGLGLHRIFLSILKVTGVLSRGDTSFLGPTRILYRETNKEIYLFKSNIMNIERSHPSFQLSSTLTRRFSFSF